MTYCYKFPNGNFTTTDEDLSGWSFRWEVNEDEQARINGGATVAEEGGVLVVGPMPAPAPVPVEPVPSSVRSAQLAQWLIEADLMSSVEAIFSTPGYWPSEKVRLKAKVRWEREVNVNRDDAMVVSLAGVLGLSEADVDAAFVAASKIV